VIFQSKETIRLIKERSLSAVRLGDGEIVNIVGLNQGIPSARSGQDHNLYLVYEIMDSIFSGASSHETGPLPRTVLPCIWPEISDPVATWNGDFLKNQRAVMNQLGLLNDCKVPGAFGSAWFPYKDNSGEFTKEHLAEVSSIFDEKNVVCILSEQELKEEVASNLSRNMLFTGATSCKFVATPASNSFRYFADIMHGSLSTAAQISHSKEDVIFSVSSGAAAIPIVKSLHKVGYQAIDLGSIHARIQEEFSNEESK